MNDRTKRILLWGVACPIFTILSLVLGFYWTFPYDHARDFIVQEAEKGGTVQLEITRLEPSWLTGVHAEGVRIAEISEGDAPPAELLLTSVDGRISILSLLGGTTNVDFEVEVDGGGQIEGNFAQSETSTHIDARIQNLDMRRVGPVRSAVGLPVFGLAQGEIDLDIGAEAADTHGTVNLTIANAAVGDGHTPLEIPGMGSGVTLERLNIGTLEFQMETERGNGEVQRLHASGEHAELWGTGSIRLAQPFERTTLDLLIRVNFTDAYQHSSDRMEAIFSILEMNPAVRPARTPNGALQWRIQGSMGGRIRMVPSGRVPMPEADE
ncbi:MAG: type II secretion system protein GspN [Sandaracinaceae bacterium]